jgi:peptide/nickel transport system ATP-binding protein
MYLGKIVEHGSVAEVIRRPQHPYTQALLGAVLEPRADFRLPEVRLGINLPSPISPPPGCAFHPRCPLAFDRCRTEAPPEVPLAGGGYARCHLAAGGASATEPTVKTAAP